MDIDDIEKHNVLRLSCFSGGKSILDKFLEEVEKNETGNMLSIWTVSESSIISSHPWVERTQRLRPLETIDLDERVKSELKGDIRKFLSRQQWYVNCEIPYSRGYLFFGPPGTGKTSTAKSLASTFGGQLYTLTLDEITDENHLRRLFSIPKKGDFILIEDIDRLDDGVMQQENVNRLVGTWRRRRRNISLSALLNAIDGPTGLNDGVILIMTSNTSELDTALVRPGRIDQTHYFPHATHDVARSIFMRLYEGDATTQESDGATSLNLDQLADEFAQQVPAETVTPAEVQGYLTIRSNPSDAVQDFGAWVEDAISRSTRRCPSTQSADVVDQEDIWMQSADM
ncbi:P-loop containing nucleoside triphosphate hydrolase protein [Aaosphaeria arxii CBS 175.79]|uniref:P-loop containing nucleoside triphosphate hydrolase protein n=1 Tax=Aaosphaeria arxii CBS 175.79 TaxID=1450172 RepID=A0A6A5XYP7_9PLEO|nr:P-loop containing nucleoside triphosphate hydrolase protein [Aaosphaeria arxii CBS 175.79]KAF2018089.1 P-loop containing nucleoside triphosphate hydrolase protein [Aaosphaeria arxii CBS 175.79]